ncbi:hypothetical protein M9Y10_044291 [Tritrichomonas musculus]|uniref:AB hydrolase-1 domain-containing protein n=1 Tax=Tritrichomonas musculus TaxID=1915356 RepID=A0ABR2K2K1_9EUKA
MGFSVILLILLIALAAFFIYRCFHTCKAKITYNPSGGMAPLITTMKSLSKPFNPTPWLVGGNLQTIMGMRFRKKSSSKYRRDQFLFEDGGTCILDWFEPENAEKDTPIVAIIHTLAGGTREPCTNCFANAVKKHGWRAVVLNCRACSGAPITSKRLYNALQVDDQQAMVRHIKEQFSPKYFFMAGFSLGSMQAINYNLSQESENIIHVDGLLLISHIYDTKQSALILERPLQSKLYLSVIISKLTHALKKNKYVEGELREAINAKTLCEFDDKFTSKTLGLKDHIEYYSKIKIYDLIPKLKVPTLIIGADDDPFTEPKYQPIKEVSESESVALLTYPEGGHVSFLTGMNGQKSVVDTVGIEYFDTIISNLKLV